jgi:hypothetical protein
MEMVTMAKIYSFPPPQKTLEPPRGPHPIGTTYIIDPYTRALRLKYPVEPAGEPLGCALPVVTPLPGERSERSSSDE